MKVFCNVLYELEVDVGTEAEAKAEAALTPYYDWDIATDMTCCPCEKEVEVEDDDGETEKELQEEGAAIQEVEDEDEAKPVTLRSLLATKGHHVRAPYRSWSNAYDKIVTLSCISTTSPDDAGGNGLNYNVFMALRDTPLKEFDRDEDNTYFELWANGKDYEVWVDAEGHLRITAFDDEATMAKPHDTGVADYQR
jgi:hypothetical protein